MAILSNFLSEEDKKMILASIQEAESKTSGEIRVRIERKGGNAPMAVARAAFEKLGMRDTVLHNGVLFVLAVSDRKFVVLGDDGINEKVPDDFWENIKDIVLEHFREQQFGQGLSEGIRLAGEQLATFFPHQKDDIDELPNAISYADEEDGK